MALLNIQDVKLHYSSAALFDGISLQIHEGEKICLLGRNGSGKSTLMKLINGSVEPDSGEVIREKGIRTALLQQDVPLSLRGSIRGIITGTDSITGSDSFHEPVPDHEADRILDMLELDGALEFETLSAGMKRRALLGRALAAAPDILLLDEPTNHLDMDSILRLEEYLASYRKTLFFVTHDRAFLQKITGRVVELDRGRLYDWKCGYTVFLQRKEEWLEGEQARNAVFDKKLAAEEVWIRKGIKARRTRNEGRVKALQKMRSERAARREVSGQVKMQLQRSESSGKMIIEAEDLSFSYSDELIIRDFSARILRGDKMGIIGPNGCGKSTLIKLMLGELSPGKGTVKTGTGLQIVYYDQLRDTIDDTLTVKENIMNGSEIIDFNGKQKHVIGYLQEFLFPPAMADMKAGVLSGGEKNRLMLAKLFTRPFNFLVMDEPTNDLDIETIELLEELLLDYEGTLMLVSHDRAFINSVVNSVFAFEPGGIVKEYAGGYDEWLAGRPSGRRESTNPPPQKEKRSSVKTKTRLSQKEKRELEEIPGRIDRMENRKHEIAGTLGDAAFYKKNGAEAVNLTRELEAIESELAQIFARWEELEAYEKG